MMVKTIFSSLLFIFLLSPTNVITVSSHPMLARQLRKVSSSECKFRLYYARVGILVVSGVGVAWIYIFGIKIHLFPDVYHPEMF
jgi:hypothetical protein